jgi:nicotinate-nucleotide adenylyltransferase
VSRLGLLGGTFDPPHYGHLVAGQEAAERLGLERVLYLPAGQPPHKLDEPVSPLEPRRRMTELAIADNPLFSLSLADCEQAEPSYTVDLLARLQRQLPAQTSLYFIVGMDSLRDLTTWKEPARVLRQCRLVVVRRPGYEPLDLQQLAAEVPGADRRIIILDTPGLDISSTELRARIAAGRSIRYLVPETVRAYIAEQKLYRPVERASLV